MLDEKDERLKWILPDTLSVGQLIEILKRYPPNMPVITTWESTIHGLQEDNIYESKEGNLYIDADYNSYKDEFAKTEE